MEGGNSAVKRERGRQSRDGPLPNPLTSTCSAASGCGLTSTPSLVHLRPHTTAPLSSPPPPSSHICLQATTPGSSLGNASGCGLIPLPPSPPSHLPAGHNAWVILGLKPLRPLGVVRLGPLEHAAGEGRDECAAGLCGGDGLHTGKRVGGGDTREGRSRGYIDSLTNESPSACPLVAHPWSSSIGNTHLA